MSIIPHLAIQYLGYPCVKYTNINEGNTPLGFTCSGFVNFILNEAGILVPNLHTYELFDRFGVLIHEGLQKPGDLVFWSKHGFKPTHVEFYLTRNTLTEILDMDYNIKKDIINGFLKDGVGNEFTIGSHGKNDSVVALNELERKIISPDEKYSHFPQLYNQNPIGFKRPAVLKEGKKYQEIWV